MPTHRPARAAARRALVVPLVALAACGRDAATAPASRLTEREAAALALQLTGRTNAAVGTGASRDLSPEGTYALAGVPAPVNLSVQTTVPCPAGGSASVAMTVTGTMDAATGSLTADLAGTFAPSSCAMPADATTLTLTGSPGVAIASHLTVANGQPTGLQTAHVTGGFAWTASDGRSGSCALDYQASLDYAANRGTVKGTVCGTAVDWVGPLR